MWYLQFSAYKMLSSVNRDHFTSSFTIWMSFISFSYLIALARISSMRLKRSGKTGHPWLFLIPERKLFFTIACDVNCGFFLYVIEIIYKSFPPSPSLSVFIMKECWVLSNVFHQLRCSCVFFPSFCECGILHWVVFLCWAILAFLG